MPRQLAPCGTPAAYRRHLRRDEKPCAACARAHAAAKSARVSSSRDQLATVTQLKIAERTASPSSEPLDPVAKARWNLQVIEARMEAGGSDLAGLSKRHMEMVEAIARLEGTVKPKESALDQLARRRAERLAASAD